MKSIDLKNMNIELILKSSYDLVKKYLSYSDAQKYRNYCYNSEYRKAIKILKKTLQGIPVSKTYVRKALENLIEDNNHLIKEVFDSISNGNEKEGEKVNQTTVSVESVSSSQVNQTPVPVENAANSQVYIAAIIIALAIIVLIAIVVIVSKKNKKNDRDTIEINNNYSSKRKDNIAENKKYTDKDRDLLEVIHLLSDTYKTTEEYLK